MKFSKTLRQRAETKIYKPKAVIKDDLFKTFSLVTQKRATPGRERKDLLEKGKIWMGQVEMDFYNLASLLIDTPR